MSSEAAKFSVAIEIDANVNIATKRGVVEFMLQRLEEMTITSIDGTEERDWDCTLSNVKLIESADNKRSR